MIFVFIEAALLLLAGSYWVLAKGHMQTALNLQVAGGACVFVFCIFGWYLELSLMLRSVEFAFEVPVFDLSTKIPGAAKAETAEKMA